MPNHQVSRFQAMAPSSAAATTTWLSILWSISPVPIVAATAVPVSAPTKFAMALITMANCGFSARVETEVAMAFAVS
jgi:hypothetical protein